MNTINHEITLPHAARTYAVLDEVAVERARHHDLSMAGTIHYDCAYGGAGCAPPDTKLRLLTLAVGEVAEAIDVLEQCSASAAPRCKEELRAKLIQVAAVAVAIAESLTEVPS